MDLGVNIVMEFDNLVNRLLKEYSSDDENIDKIVNLLSTTYRSRRIIMTEGKF